MTEGYKPCDLCGSTIPDEPNELDDLRAEVLLLRGEAERERAAIVRWLRDEAARLRKAEFVGSRAYVLESTAYMIENGVHADQKEKA